MTIEWIKVDEARLRGDQELFQTYLREFQESRQQMIDRMNELNTVWRGPSKEAFLQQFEADCELLTEVCEKLREMDETMRAAADEYQNCDGNVSSIISGIRI